MTILEEINVDNYSDTIIDLMINISSFIDSRIGQLMYGNWSNHVAFDGGGVQAEVHPVDRGYRGPGSGPGLFILFFRQSVSPIVLQSCHYDR